MMTIERNRKLDQLTEIRTQILQNFLEVLEDQLMQAEALGMEYVDDLKLVRLHLGRRTGATTWIKEMLLEYDLSCVVCSALKKKHEYKEDKKAVDKDTLIMCAPGSFKGHLVFLDLHPNYDYPKIIGYFKQAKCIVIV